MKSGDDRTNAIRKCGEAERKNLCYKFVELKISVLQNGPKIILARTHAESTKLVTFNDLHETYKITARQTNLHSRVGHIPASVKMARSELARFGTVDYAVFAIMLVLSTCVGIYHALAGGRQKTTQEFLLANRRMMSLPVAVSLLASFMSAITILGVPAEIYTFGTEYWFIVVSYVFLFPITAHVFVPVFHGLDITSAYEVRLPCVTRTTL